MSCVSLIVAGKLHFILFYLAVCFLFTGILLWVHSVALETDSELLVAGNVVQGSCHAKILKFGGEGER